MKSLKILFVAYHNASFMSITEYCEKAIRQLGHECIVFDDRKFILPGRLRQSLSVLHDWDVNQLNKRLLRCAAKEKPDLCIVAGGHRIRSSTIEKLKKQGVITVLWTIDPPRFFDKYNSFSILQNTASYYDHVFCGGTEAIELLSDLKLKNINWLPFACDDELHKPVTITKHEQKMYGNDIVFVGSYYENRACLLQQISDFDLGVWGPGWEKLGFDSPLKQSIKYAGNIKSELWLKIYAASKLVIIPHYQDGKTLCYQVSPKVYEALACKCTTLVDNQKDIYPNFEDGKHLAVFNNVEELRNKIQYLLDTPDKASNMARAGYEKVIENHTYKHRIKQIIKATIQGD